MIERSEARHETGLSIEEAFERLAQKAKTDGAEIELLVEKSDSTSISFQKGKLDSFESATEHCAGLRIIFRGNVGYSYSENLAWPALEASYGDAYDNARFSARGKGQEHASSEARLYSDSSDVPEDSSMYRFSASDIEIEKKLEYARVLESATLEVDSRIVSVPNSEYSENFGEILIYNSEGIHRRQRRASVSGYVYCLARDAAENRTGMKSFFSRSSHHRPDDRPIDVIANEIAREAAASALRKLGSDVPETGRYPVLIEADVAKSFLSLVIANFSARHVFEKTSFFANQIGKAIASPLLQITDDPFLSDGLASRPFDGEGAGSRKTELIKNGILQSYLTNSDFARRMGLPHTASASRGARSQLDISPSNLVVSQSDKSRAELQKVFPRVIVLTSLTGFHAGYQEGSGDFSLQSEGELWENGEFVRPLANFVTSGNIRDALKRIVGLGNRYPRRTSSVLAPDLLIEELSVAGK
jgi:PmbA protein